MLEWDCDRLIRNDRVIWASCMVASKDADAMVTGNTRRYSSSLEKVIFARVYLVNFQDFDRMNEVYSSFFKSDKLPGRTCIGVTGLAVGSLVEIDFVAAA